MKNSPFSTNQMRQTITQDQNSSQPVDTRSKDYWSPKSNHPKSVIRNIPKGVNKRLSENSANEDLFNSAVPVYQEAFKNDGYDFQLNYEPQEENNNAENNDNRNFKGDSRVNTRMSEKLHFYILIFPQKIVFLKIYVLAPRS